MRFIGGDGFSLTELLVVLALLGIGLGLLSQTGILSQRSNDRLSRSDAGVAALMQPLELLRADVKLAESAQLSSGSLILEYKQLDPVTRALRRRRITYSHDPATRVLSRAQLDVEAGGAPQLVPFPGIPGARWCLDDGTSSCAPGVPRFGQGVSHKRLIAEFDYPSPATDAMSTLAFVADLDNLPFDCRGAKKTTVVKAN